MSLGLVSYDGSHEFYAEFTDYDSSQLDEWLREHILGNFTLSEMKDPYFEYKGNQRLFKGEAEWVVSHPKGLKAWLKSFGEKIVCASSGNTYDWVLFRSLLGVKYKEDLPEYIDGWSMDVISLFRWEGHIPRGRGFQGRFHRGPGPFQKAQRVGGRPCRKRSLPETRSRSTTFKRIINSLNQGNHVSHRRTSQNSGY